MENGGGEKETNEPLNTGKEGEEESKKKFESHPRLMKFGKFHLNQISLSPLLPYNLTVRKTLQSYKFNHFIKQLVIFLREDVSIHRTNL